LPLIKSSTNLKRGLIGTLRNKRFSNPYVEKVKEFDGIVLNEYSIVNAINKNPLPLILDIGCGNGEYLTDLASKNPHNFYLGFERQFKEVHRTALKIQKAGLKNCVVASMDASGIPALFNEKGLSGIFILFPDPWPKTKQKKNRLVQKQYLIELASKIIKGGFIKIRTDNDDYFLHMLKILYDEEIKKILETQIVSRDYHHSIREKDEYITPFERIFLRDGALINYVFLKRV